MAFLAVVQIAPQGLTFQVLGVEMSEAAFNLAYTVQEVGGLVPSGVAQTATPSPGAMTAVGLILVEPVQAAAASSAEALAVTEMGPSPPRPIPDTAKQS